MTPEPEERLNEDTLFLACTRPAMLLGVPLEAMAINGTVSMLVFLLMDSIFYLLVAPPIHLVFAAICKHDPNAFRVLFQWSATKGRARNKAAWGGSSPAPLPLRRRYVLAEVRRG